MSQRAGERASESVSELAGQQTSFAVVLPWTCARLAARGAVALCALALCAGALLARCRASALGRCYWRCGAVGKEWKA